MLPPKEIPLTVVVNGQPTVVLAPEDAPLSAVIPVALRQTQNLGQPPENWELRDADGDLLDLDKKVGAFGFTRETRLFLNLKAGVGGAMASTVSQYVDPAVSRAKFDREVAEFLTLDADYRARGWFLVKAEWPLATVLLVSKRTSPPAIVTTVRFDYTNYDVEPPSVRLVDPFSGRPLMNKELPLRLHRMIPGPETVLPDGNTIQLNTAQDLMQAPSPDDVPLLCIPGVKEYHDHPGHSGDPWELHRPAGTGRLVRLLEVITKYGLAQVTGFSVNLVPQVTFAVSEPPE
ncbi:MAG: DUF2604 domain-containing protein [Acidimicrobiia bacterium]|nr:DUF2604 domain-containing protein [Acidimicrobiia bacterium]